MAAHPLVTAPGLEAIRDELAAKEPLFHHPEQGDTRADLERLAREDFWGIGASGAPYSRSTAIEDVLERFADPNYVDPWSTSDVRCQQLAQDLYLLTYELDQAGRRTRRTTLWAREADTWRVVFHQGTLLTGG
ncbi:MAG: DUF4440 domain-containing protein [Solirubrobacteraceae bacterium]|nr:DUF4440 domain-containing protein [Patulibacter sp.]